MPGAPPFATSWPSSPKGDARTLRDLLSASYGLIGILVISRCAIGHTFGVESIPVQEQTVNQFHRPGLFPVDGQITIRPFVIAQKMPVGNTHLAISEPLPMALGDVFRDAPAFFLCQAAHDGDEEFPFTANFDTK